jgi:saccharopine dehydrogenase-like NADP-dependent oxidoreductase
LGLEQLNPVLKPFLRGRRVDRRKIAILRQGDIILDCLPGSQAPRIADTKIMSCYANLTEYVAETEKIKTLAKDATTGFILQTGLAPVTSTYANGLFQQFCTDFKVDSVTNLN